MYRVVVSVMQGLTSWASAELPRYVLAGQQQWQPSDLLPDPSNSDYLQQVNACGSCSPIRAFVFMHVVVCWRSGSKAYQTGTVGAMQHLHATSISISTA
jgi:hypothetical protein